MSGSPNEDTRKRSPIAIVGMGCMFPKADGLESYWANICEGIDAITEVPETHWRPEDYFSEDQKKPDFTYGRRGGFLSPFEFDPLKYGIPPNALEATDTSQLLGMVVAERALEDAGYGEDRDFSRENVSVILGVTGTLELVIPLGARLGHPRWKKAMSDAGVNEATARDVMERISDSYVDWQENSFPGLLGNVVAGRISKHLDLGGTNCVVDAACASSLSAIHLAALELESGKADMVVSGGIDTFNDIFMYMCFSKTPALSPTGDAKPFDQGADGTILGEGLGVVVLKRLEDAERDGDRIYAVLKGIGSSSDGKGDAIYAPSAAGQQKALRTAYENAGVSPGSIELLEAHGTGTKKGDAVEANALAEVYSKDGRDAWCALGSVKSQIGHTKSSAGAAGIIKAAMALYDKVLPPTIKVERPQDVLAPGATPFYVNTAKRPWLPSGDYPRRAAVSSFGFGGSNFHCVLEEHRAAKTQTTWDGRVQIVAISAATKEELRSLLPDWEEDVPWDRVRDFAAQSRARFDSTAAQRLVLVLEQGTSSPHAIVGAAQKRIADAGEANWSTPDGAAYGSGPVEGKLAVLFPGQGTQYTGMLRDFACRFPSMLDTLDEANSVLGAAFSGKRLHELIYPHPTFDAESAQANQAALTSTDVAQPAIGAASLGAFRVLQGFGLKAEAFAGHSYGELTALCAAGRMEAETFFRISALRGSLMAGDGEDRGGMAAVRAPLDDVESILSESGLGLVVANKNTPDQAVISGETGAISQAVELFKSRDIRCTVLDVGAAFHSPLVAGVSGPFLEGLQAHEFSDSAIPVFANTTGDVYPSDPSEAKKLLAGQLAQPVEFVREIEEMYAAGVRAFVEVGPGARMSGLVRAVLGDKEHAVYALDASNGKRDGVLDLARLLAALAASGHPLSLSEWDADYRPAKVNDGKKRFTVPICGANYVAPKKTKAAMPKAKAPVAPAKPAPAAAQVATVKKSAPASAQVRTPAQVQAPAPVAAVPSMEPSTAADLLAQTQANIAALQRMQEHTAALHKQYLEGQENAASAIRNLLQQQQGVFQPGVVPAPQPVAAERPPAPIETSVETSIEPAQPLAEEAALPAPVSTSDEQSDGLRVGLLEVVAEKTGYPAEMLEPGMSLDGDLGIDSIKRVEILSALQERFPELPTIEAEELGAIQTLADILEHLGTPEHLDGAVEPAADVGDSIPTEGNYQGLLLAIVAEKTGYPVDMLEVGMSLDGDLGIDSIKRVEILSALQEEAPELPTSEAEDLGRLQTLEDILNHLDAVAPVAAATTSATASFDVSPLLLEIVAEKTGYPVDMLELGMSLDADLGIDSIKRVEILSALQERVPELPTVEAEDLGNMVTLQDVVSYLGEAQPDASLPVATPPSPPKTSVVESTLLAIVSEKTGYPSDMLELDMGLEGDLGIDSIKRVEILSALQERMPELSAIEAEDLGKLHTLHDVIAFISDDGESAHLPAATPSNGTPALPETDESASCAIRRSTPTCIPLDEAAREAIAIRPNATIWVTDDGSEFSAAIVTRFEELEYAAQLVPIDELPSATPDRLDGLVIVAPEAPIGGAYLKQAFALAQIAAPILRQADDDQCSVFATISRLDGGFGLIGLEAGRSPLSGGLAGLSKTASHEWPEVACKALDVASDFKSVAKAASAAVDELLLSAPLEVGLSRTSRVTLSLEEQALESVVGTPRLAASDVVVVTGGARGVTAEVAVAMAKRYRCGLALLGRTELAGAEDAYLNGLESEAAIKKAVLDHADQKLTPKDLERICRGVLAHREIEATLKRIEVAGGRGMYLVADIRKPDAVSTAIGQASKTLGTVTALVHGAGVLADRRIEDKTAEQFDLVYDTKVAGMNTLLSVLNDSPLKAIVLFSSSTARFGRTGQSDYAMANEVLNKTALAEATQRSDCRVLSMNWGPWDGGMVTPALKKIFEDEGVGVIGLEAGAELLLDELDAPEQGAVEIVILADPPGGASPPMAVSSSRSLESVVELSLETEAFPFLTSHVIDNKPVLPVAMYVEWFAHAALHGNPGMRFRGITDLRVLKGVVLDGNGPMAIRVCAGEAVSAEGGVTVPLEFRSVDAKGRDTLNAQANAILVSRLEKGEAALGPIDRNGSLPEASALYNGCPLFHGPAFQGIREIEGCSERGIAALVSPAPRPVEWIHEPLRKSWIADPLVLDAAFQLMIVWSDATRGACSLPVAFRAYTQYQSTFPKGPVRIVANVIESGPHKAVADIEFYNASNDQLLAAIDGYECVIDASLNEAFKRNRCEPSPTGR